MDFNNITVTMPQKGIALVTINRPKKLNALNSQTISELSTAFTNLESQSDVRVIVLTGVGDKAFVAGADISEFAHFSREEGEILSKKGQDSLFNRIENLRKPVIAAINGFALGGGLELAMACHFRIASENAKMGLPEVSLGVIPGYGGTQRLPQLIGKGRALELIVTGDMIDATSAKDYGLVNHVVSQEELKETCYKKAVKILQNSPNAIAKAIGAVNASFREGVDGYSEEIVNFGACFGTPEFNEGTQAFLNKRKANF
ncbi:MAG: enoyl-CoA hydratase/isomerase family protein [Flavicella sp.]